MQQVARQPLKFTCEWKIETDLVVVGPEAVTVLQVEAIRDCEISTIKLDAPGIPDDTVISAVVCEQTRAQGRRLLRTQRLGGPQRVIGRENLPGRLGEPLATNQFRPPHDYWLWNGSIELGRGQVLGIVVQASRHCVVKACVAGR